MHTVSLDMYDYDFVMDGNTVKSVVINVTGNTDVTIADIASEITNSENNIYVEGYRLIHKNSYFRKKGRQSQFVIDVIDVTPNKKK